jgi:hypothetical protein
MAAFEDNNPFASPSSPSSSRANSYAPFGSFPGPYSPTTPASTANPLHAAHASFDSTNRPMTSSSEDAPAYQFQATNSDFSDPRPGTPGESGMETPAAGGTGGGTPATRETDGEMCCKIDEVFVRNPEMRIVISDAGKASDGGANFIAYTIQVGVGSFSLVFASLCGGKYTPFGIPEVDTSRPLSLFLCISSYSSYSYIPSTSREEDRSLSYPPLNIFFHTRTPFSLLCARGEIANNPGPDSPTPILRIRLPERSSRPLIPNINHPPHPRETFHVYFPCP